ncbi:peptidase S41 [Bacteroidia bacterium]|nr:peptidase S41 [Bacteroidia bacterium]
MNACSYGQNNNIDPSIRKVEMAMYFIENLYVDSVDKNKLAEDAIVSLLEKLDPHSNYMTPDEVKELNEPLQGTFDGIGIQFNMLFDTLYVVQVIPGGPSEKVGILAGDRIIFVNDTVIAGVKMKSKDVVSRLRGQKGTTVTVKVLRSKVPELLEFNITRDKIPVYSLDASYMVDKETGYIKLNRFAATSFDEFKEALQKLKGQGMKNLIFDLQGNGGGYLGSAIEIAKEFLKPGSLIVYTEGVSQKRENATAGNKGAFEQGKLVVLVDESSASASEIVSGAIQDWDRGVIVGRRSFGKGLVQRPIDLPDGSMIRLTTARYYTPTGRSIQKPYENGDLESYHKELIERYNKGEMLSADSIHFPDSLKYSTLVNKRTVYGGGGIMPDYFVPIDTTHSSLLHRQLISRGILYKYTLSHVDANRNTYKSKYPTFEAFNKQFTVSDGMLEDLLTFYKKEIANPNENSMFPGDDDDKEDKSPESKPEENKAADVKPSDLDKSKSLVQKQIKALIARELFGENQYYQVINTEIDAYLKAIEIINDAKEYDKLLGKK